MADIYIFKRVEKKYRLSSEQKERFLSEIREQLVPDEHGVSTVCSLYLDTPSFLLIRNSIDADAYKEKLRVRSYGLPRDDTKVFFEIKKKYCGVVYKRRISMRHDEAMSCIRNGEIPMDGQIADEINYALRYYDRPKPRAAILYEREAYTLREDPSLRITFDGAVRYRTHELECMRDLEGEGLLDYGVEIMEIKTSGTMPLWLSRALDECGIFPQSFSKYGSAFLKMTGKECINEGDCFYV